MTKEEEAAAILVGVGMTIAVVVMFAVLLLATLFGADERPRGPSEWRETNGRNN